MNKIRDILNGYNIEIINDKFKVDKIEKIIINFIHEHLSSAEYIIFLFNRYIDCIINDTLFNIENMASLVNSFGVVEYTLIFLKKLVKISKIINMKGNVYLVVKELNICCFRGV